MVIRASEQASKDFTEDTERAHRERTWERKQTIKQAGRQASMQARKQASIWSAFSRSHALEGLVLRNKTSFGALLPKKKFLPPRKVETLVKIF